MTDSPATLDGRTALVSGGARGIGAAHVRALVGAGARVAIGDLLDEAGVALAAELGDDRALFVHLDVTDEEQWVDAVTAAENWSRHPVSILVNNAGINAPSRVEPTTLDAWNRTLAVNLTGHFLGTRAVIEPMRRAGGGAIVNTASMIVNDRMPEMAAYAASKSGIQALTRITAMELAPDGIRVNALYPGMIASDMTAHSDPGIVLPRIPLGRYGTPDDVARTMLFIVRDADYATGSDFAVDGGITAGRPRAVEHGGSVSPARHSGIV